MSLQGDSAEQIVRLSFAGAESVLKITGAAAKNVAAFLLAAFKSDGKPCETKLRGEERLTKMIQCEKPIKIFAVKNEDVKKFSKEAKRYGLAYCLLREKDAKPGQLIDIMVKEQDAPKVDRILEKLKLMSVDRAAAQSTATNPTQEKGAPDVADNSNIMDLLIDDEGKPLVERTNEQEVVAMPNPPSARIESGTLQEPTSEMPPKIASTDTMSSRTKKTSVKGDLNNIAAQKKQESGAKSVTPTLQLPKSKTKIER